MSRARAYGAAGRSMGRDVVVAAFAALLLAAACVQTAAPPTTGSAAPGTPNLTVPAPSDALSPAATSTPAQPATVGPSEPASPVAPSGESLAYVLDGNIWLTSPEGTAARQLTLDGTAEDGYHSPAHGPDGTIFALRGSSQLYHFDGNGQPVGTPVMLPTLENGAEGVAVATDGAHIAYVTTGYGTEVDPRFGNPVGVFLYGGTDVATLDGTSIPGAALASMLYPTWLGPTTLALADGVDVYYAQLGQEAQQWITVSDGCVIEFDCPSGQPAQASFSRTQGSRDGRLLAYSYDPYFGQAGRRIAVIDAPPPAAPLDVCLMPDQQDHSDSGSFSPDATRFAFDDTRFDPDAFDTVVGDGVWVMDVDLDAADCGFSTARLVVPGGAQPDWGPTAP